jgi:CO/xanthine dehydrogenase Mo-binding subunit
MDVPDTNEPILNGHPDPRSAFGGRSLGEPATEPAAAAIACAVNMALGKPGAIKELPFNLERVMEIAQEIDKQRDVDAASAAVDKA